MRVNVTITEALMRAKQKQEQSTFFLVSDAMLGYKTELEYCYIIMNNLMYKKCHSSFLKYYAIKTLKYYRLPKTQIMYIVTKIHSLHLSFIHLSLPYKCLSLFASPSCASPSKKLISSSSLS